MSRMLVAVDGSEGAAKAARVAAQLAQGLRSQVTLLHVVSPVIIPGDASWAPVETLRDAELSRGQDVVHEVQRSLAPLETRELVKVGVPAETIVEVAESLEADLVVVGSHGKGAVQRFLVGSVADRVVHLCRRPVLVVR